MRWASRGEQARHIALEPGEELGVAEHAVLDDFRDAGTKFARRQGGEGVAVGDHQSRLMEGADEILAAGVIDPGLAAHTGIDLGEQRGGHLHEIDAAQIDGRHESGQITNDAATKRHQGGVARSVRLQQPIETGAHLVH